MITRYVNTASTAGGNGTTNDTVGANRAYASLSAAVAYFESSPPSEDVTILCCGTAADVGNLTINDCTASGYTITIAGNPNVSNGRFPGYYSTNHYRWVSNSFPSAIAVSISSGRTVRLLGLQAIQNSCWDVIRAFGSGLFVVDSCFIKGAKGIDQYANTNVLNTVFVNAVGSSHGIQRNWGVLYAYNCLFTGFNSGVWGWGSAVVKNCIAFNNGTDFNDGLTIDHCASDDNSGTNPITVSNWGDQFYNASYATDVDFRLNTTSVLLGAGIGPALDVNVPLLDILGYSRSGSTATVGPFQYSWDFAPPVADFEGNPTGGYLPLGVTFTDLTTPAPSGWAWNFGDGSPTGTSQYPYHVYTGVGSYTVEMSVWNGVSDTETKVNYINVLASPPIADFSLNVTSGYAPLSVYFTDTSISSTSILSWSWSFGDGYTSTSQNPSHVYTAPGLYTVTLTVVNVSGPDTETKVGVLRVESAEPTLVTYDLAPPQNDDLLAHMPATGDGDTNLYSKGVRYYIRSSVSSPAKSGFRRVSGPTLIFD